MAVMVHLAPEIHEEAKKLRSVHEEKLKAYLEARKAGLGKVDEEEVKRLFKEERVARTAWDEFYQTHYGLDCGP
jgi:hypothetical protein